MHCVKYHTESKCIYLVLPLLFLWKHTHRLELIELEMLGSIWSDPGYDRYNETCRLLEVILKSVLTALHISCFPGVNPTIPGRQNDTGILAGKILKELIVKMSKDLNSILDTHVLGLEV